MQQLNEKEWKVYRFSEISLRKKSGGSHVSRTLIGPFEWALWRKWNIRCRLIFLPHAPGLPISAIILTPLYYLSKISKIPLRRPIATNGGQKWRNF